ncbi:MAG: alpha/beta fold hydrolase [Nanoarchaeota archaeon]
MIKIYLIHGWGGDPNSEAWFPWLKKECKKRNIELIVPEMPNTNNPKIKEWINKLEKVIKINNNIYLIGHSIGCQAIMRYLEKINKKVKGIIFVAPWMKLDMNTIKEEGQKSIDIAKTWMETPIDFKKVKNNADRILALFSDDDPYVSLSEADIFKQELEAEIIIKENECHFNDTKEINEIFKFIDRR